MSITISLLIKNNIAKNKNCKINLILYDVITFTSAINPKKKVNYRKILMKYLDHKIIILLMAKNKKFQIKE